MCYGIDPVVGARIAQWKAQGYRVHVMTGVAWGEYQDYLYGRFDGQNHVDEAYDPSFLQVLDRLVRQAADRR